MAVDFITQDESPLFPQILYNRPVTRSGAGRLLIPGGHTGEISQPTALFELAMAAGAGECTVALPDTLVKILSGAPSTTFLPSSPSGSLAREALAGLIELSEDADAVALGVSLSNNSETAILIDRFTSEVERPVIAFDEAIALSLPSLGPIVERPQNLLVITMPEVFKLADRLGVAVQIHPGGGLINKLEIVEAVSSQIGATMFVYGTELIIAGGNEPLVVTPTNHRLSQYPTLYFALASVFWLQNPTRRRAGLVTAAYVAGKVSAHIGQEGRHTVGQLAKFLRHELVVD